MSVTIDLAKALDKAYEDKSLKDILDALQAVLPTKKGHPHWGAPWCGCVVTGAGRRPAAGCQRPTRDGRSLTRS